MAVRSGRDGLGCPGPGARRGDLHMEDFRRRPPAVLGVGHAVPREHVHTRTQARPRTAGRPFGGARQDTAAPSPYTEDIPGPSGDA